MAGANDGPPPRRGPPDDVHQRPSKKIKTEVSELDELDEPASAMPEPRFDGPSFNTGAESFSSGPTSQMVDQAVRDLQTYGHLYDRVETFHIFRETPLQQEDIPRARSYSYAGPNELRAGQGQTRETCRPQAGNEPLCAQPDELRARQGHATNRGIRNETRGPQPGNEPLRARLDEVRADQGPTDEIRKLQAENRRLHVEMSKLKTGLDELKENFRLLKEQVDVSHGPSHEEGTAELRAGRGQTDETRRQEAEIESLRANVRDGSRGNDHLLAELNELREKVRLLEQQGIRNETRRQGAAIGFLPADNRRSPAELDEQQGDVSWPVTRRRHRYVPRKDPSVVEDVSKRQTEQGESAAIAEILHKASTLDVTLGTISAAVNQILEDQTAASQKAEARLASLEEGQKGINLLLHTVHKTVDPPDPETPSRKRIHTGSGDESQDETPVDDDPPWEETDWTRSVDEYMKKTCKRLQSINVVDDGMHETFDITANRLMAYVADDADWPRFEMFFNEALEGSVYCLGQLMEDPKCTMPDELTPDRRKCPVHGDDPDKPCFPVRCSFVNDEYIFIVGKRTFRDNEET